MRYVDGFYDCEFCGCHTNAHLRMCCDSGNRKDRKMPVRRCTYCKFTPDDAKGGGCEVNYEHNWRDVCGDCNSFVYEGNCDCILEYFDRHPEELLNAPEACYYPKPEPPEDI